MLLRKMSWTEKYSPFNKLQINSNSLKEAACITKLLPYWKNFHKLKLIFIKGSISDMKSINIWEEKKLQEKLWNASHCWQEILKRGKMRIIKSITENHFDIIQ